MTRPVDPPEPLLAVRLDARPVDAEVEAEDKLAAEEEEGLPDAELTRELVAVDARETELVELPDAPPVLEALESIELDPPRVVADEAEDAVAELLLEAVAASKPALEALEVDPLEVTEAEALAPEVDPLAVEKALEVLVPEVEEPAIAAAAVAFRPARPVEGPAPCEDDDDLAAPGLL